MFTKPCINIPVIEGELNRLISGKPALAQIHRVALKLSIFW